MKRAQGAGLKTQGRDVTVSGTKGKVQGARFKKIFFNLVRCALRHFLFPQIENTTDLLIPNKQIG